MSAELNDAARALNTAYRERFEAGYSVASAEMDRLDQLAKSIAASCQWWAESVKRLEGAKSMDATRAADLILETSFDECLSPEVWRYLEVMVKRELGAA